MQGALLSLVLHKLADIAEPRFYIGKAQTLSQVRRLTYNGYDHLGMETPEKIT